MAVGVDFGWYRYVDEKGRNRAVRISKEVGDNPVTGFAAWNADDPYMRADYMRYANVQSAAGDTRRIPVGSSTADLWTGVATSIALERKGEATPVAYNVKSTRGETEPRPSTVVNI